MPRRYPPEAIAHCKKLYLQHNGDADAVERAMRLRWPSWSRQALVTRGSGQDLRLGWIDKEGWDTALAAQRARHRSDGLSVDETLLSEVDDVRRLLHERITSRETFDRDLIYQHRDYVAQTTGLLIQLRRADTLENFTRAWERLLEWLREIDPQTTRALVGHTSAIMERAQRHWAD